MHKNINEETLPVWEKQFGRDINQNQSEKMPVWNLTQLANCLIILFVTVMILKWNLYGQTNW